MNNRSNRNWIWGVFFIVCAILVVLNGIGIFNLAWFLWKVIFTIFCAMAFMECRQKHDVSGMVIFGAILFLIWKKNIGLGFVSFGTVLIAVILLLIGLSFLNKPSIPKAENVEIAQDENHIIRLKSAFNSSSHYLRGEEVENVYLTPSFCSMSVYFDQIGLKDQKVIVYVDCGFSTLNIYIPKKWAVQNDLKAMFGSVKLEGVPLPMSEGTIIFKGDANFSSVQITRI